MTWANGGATRTSTPQHRAFRKAVLHRDDYTCQTPGCGHHDPTGRTLRADHITNHARGGTDHPGNGQTLCTPCHDTKTQQEAAAGRIAQTRHPRERHPGLL